MKKKSIIVLLVAFLVVISAVGTAVAAWQGTKEGQGAIIADISVGDIGIQIKQEGTATAELEPEMTPVPGSSVPCEMKIENQLGNNQSNGYDIYAKVVIYKNWYDKEEQYMDSQQEDFLVEDIVFINPQGAMESYEAYEPGDITSNDWLLYYKDAEQLVLYYTKPLTYGEASLNFMDEILFSSEMGNKYANASCQLTYEVTAVQANNGQEAIAAELGVFPSFDEDGNITAIRAERP